MQLDKRLRAPSVAGALAAWCIISASALLHAEPLPATSVQSALSAVAEPFETLYQFNLNGKMFPDLASLLVGMNGDLFMSADQLREMGLNELPMSVLNHDGIPYIRLRDLRGAVLSINAAEQSLSLQIDPSAFNATTVSLTRSSAQEKRQIAAGAFMNYNLLATESAGARPSLASLFEVGILSKNGVGLSTFAYAPAASSEGGPQKLLRLDTSWRHDEPQNLSTLVIGDSYQRVNLLGRSVRFGGISYSTNFQLQPNLVTTPLQAISGVATLPSTAEIYINQKLTETKTLPSGPFSITNIPAISGSGEVSVVVRDLLGKEQVLSQPFYSNQSLLAPGMRDYAFDAGLVRQNYARSGADYGPFTSSFFYRQGITRDLTGEARLYHLGRDVAGGAVATWAAGAGAIHGLANARLMGSHTGDGATSLLRRGEPAGTRGLQAGVGYTREPEYRQKNAVKFLLDATFTSTSYLAPGTARTDAHPRSEFLAAIGRQIGPGSLGVNLFERCYRDAPDARIISASYNSMLGKGALTVSLSKSRSGTATDTTAFVSMSFPLGGDDSRTRATFDILRNADGSVIAAASVQLDPLQEPGTGYHATVRSDGQTDTTLLWRRNEALYTAEVARSPRGATGVRAGMQGGVGIVEGHVFTSPPIDGSFAIVKVDSYANVKVFRENNLVGTTGANGYSVVTSLRPYGDNVLSIDPSDIPIGAKIGNVKMHVSPYYRGASIASFPVKRVQSVLFRLVDENGADIPAGTLVKGGLQPATVGADGEVFLQEIPQTDIDHQRYSLVHSLSVCYFHLPSSIGKEVLADIGIVVCIHPK